MSRIKPFKAYRPAPGNEKKVASRPYDVLNSNEARAERKGNDLSFLRINKPECDFPENHRVSPQEIYEHGRANFLDFIDAGILQQDDSANYYVYRLIMGNHEQYGLVCCTAIEDYFDGSIKIHEYTRPEKEEDRLLHMQTVGAHIGPVFLTYPAHPEISKVVKKAAEGNPLFHFKAEDDIQHTGWAINNPADIETITRVFKEDIPHTYVADGHHRSAASARVGRALQEQNPQDDGSEAYHSFLTVLFPDNQLQILDYNRVISDLNGLSKETFLQAIEESYSITKEKAAVKPQQANTFGMYIDNQWYRLTLKPELENPEDPIDSLGISMLSNHLIAPVLGIDNQRTSKRIDFVGGIRGLGELERLVDEGSWMVAFAVPPVSVQELMKVADAGMVMPPKSTWFEPKLRSGLFIHRFR